MKLFYKGHDGGNESNVTGYWLIESKRFFSIVLLCFHRGSREAFHNHAFHAVSWILKGRLYEEVLDSSEQSGNLSPSLKPIFTSKSRMHKVFGIADKTWVISFRGPWDNTWKEFLPKEKRFSTLTHGRKVID